MTPAECRALKRAAAKVDQAVVERNQAIIAAHRGGASYREIAGCIGTIGHTAVFKIVKAAGPVD